MNALWGHLSGVITVVLMIAFVAVWAWAWLPGHKRDFDALAKIPMEDDAGECPR